MHLTQPTISSHIKSLKQEMGVSLFDRSGSRLQLTEAARLLLPWAHKLGHQSKEMQAMVSSLATGVVGQLRLACSTPAGKYVLPQMVARFCKRYPRIQVSILACMPELVIHRLLEAEADVGMVS